MGKALLFQFIWTVDFFFEKNTYTNHSRRKNALLHNPTVASLPLHKDAIDKLV